MKEKESIPIYRLWLGVVLSLLIFTIHGNASDIPIPLEEIKKALHGDAEKNLSGLYEYICESEDLDFDTLIPLFAEVLLGDKDEYTRVNAAGLLSCIRDPRVVTPLTKALQDPSPEVRRRATDALGYVAGNIDSQNFQDAIPELLEALNDSDIWVRISAASSLGDIGDPTAVPKLLESLQDENRDVQASSIRALGWIGDPSTLPILIERFHREDDSYIRSITVSALGRIEGTSVLPVLLQALNDDKWSVRKAAVEALGGLNDPSVIPSLIETLNDSDGIVRWKTVDILGKFGEPSTIPYLKKLEAEDPYMKEIPANRAKSRGFDEQRDGKYYIYPVRRAAQEALKRLEPGDTPTTAEPTEVPTVIPSVIPSSEPMATPFSQPTPPVPPEPIWEPPSSRGHYAVLPTRTELIDPDAVTPAAELQSPPELQAPEVEPETVAKNVNLIGWSALIIVVVVCGAGYFVYKRKLRKF